MIAGTVSETALLCLLNRPCWRAACPSGCTTDESGSFNARVQWREFCSDPTRGGLETYIYGPQRENVCGDDWFWGNGAEITGDWQHIRMWVKLNDIGALSTCAPAHAVLSVVAGLPSLRTVA